jgi:hypothetical protein
VPPPTPTVPPPTPTLPPPTPTLPPPTPTLPPPTPTPELAVEQGPLLFADQFTSGGPGGWANAQGFGWSVSYVNDQYRVTASAGSGHIWSYRTAFQVQGAYSLGADVRVLSGDAGLIMYYVNEQNYLAFFINPASGRYILEQRVGGTARILADEQSAAIQQGPDAFNRLVAHLQGNQVRLFINNQPVLQPTTVEGSTPTNVYGVVAYARDVGTAEAFFDNLEIHALE